MADLLMVVEALWPFYPPQRTLGGVAAISTKGQ